MSEVSLPLAHINAAVLVPLDAEAVAPVPQPLPEVHAPIWVELLPLAALHIVVPLSGVYQLDVGAPLAQHRPDSLPLVLHPVSLIDELAVRHLLAREVGRGPLRGLLHAPPMKLVAQPVPGVGASARIVEGGPSPCAADGLIGTEVTLQTGCHALNKNLT